jgi:undecaprenyl diphosphate synthase
MDEVNFLMKLFEKSLRKYGKKFVKNGVRFRVIGDMSKLPALLQTTICEFSNDTKNFSRFNVTIAINYGARDEIVQAVRNICRDKNIDPDEIDWGFLQKYLYTADLPDPDLIIRTSGELRLSNFLLLQGAYSELFFTKTLWPDFWEREFREAIENYQHRERRMGA